MNLELLVKCIMKGIALDDTHLRHEWRDAREEGRAAHKLVAEMSDEAIKHGDADDERRLRAVQARLLAELKEARRQRSRRKTMDPTESLRAALECQLKALWVSAMCFATCSVVIIDSGNEPDDNWIEWVREEMDSLAEKFECVRGVLNLLDERIAWDRGER